MDKKRMILPYKLFTKNKETAISGILSLAQRFKISGTVVEIDMPDKKHSDEFNERASVLDKIRVLNTVLREGFQKAESWGFSGELKTYLQQFKDQSVEKLLEERQVLTQKLYEIKI